MGLQRSLRKVLWRFGYDVSRFKPSSNPIAPRRKLIESSGITTVLDVGANTGQFAQQMRNDLSFRGKIVSFEPLSTAYGILAGRAADDPSWEVFNVALGDKAGTGEIHVSGNSQSSSLLDMLPAHLEAAPESIYIGSETIRIQTLDAVFEDIAAEGDVVYLKIDTQGFEKKVIDGARASLARIDYIQMEMSFTPLYDGELPFHEMHRFLRELGYELVSVEPGFTDIRTGRLLQADGIFRRV